MTRDAKIWIGFAVAGLFLLYHLTNQEAAPTSAVVAQDAAVGRAVTAEQLAYDYGQNEVRADEQYKRQLLSVTGVITSIGNDILDHPYIIIGSGKREYEYPQVQCSFDDKAAVAALNKGQQITVTGECRGKFMHVQLDKCH